MQPVLITALISCCVLKYKSHMKGKMGKFINNLAWDNQHDTVYIAGMDKQNYCIVFDSYMHYIFCMQTLHCERKIRCGQLVLK